MLPFLSGLSKNFSTQLRKRRLLVTRDLLKVAELFTDLQRNSATARHLQPLNLIINSLSRIISWPLPHVEAFLGRGPRAIAEWALGGNYEAEDVGDRVTGGS